MTQIVTDREGFAAFMLRMRSRGINSHPLMGAIEATPRRSFVPNDCQNHAWGNRMLPIACGEAIEGLDLQAFVIHHLELDSAHRVLEIGAGTGFTAAVMARLSRRVYSTERFRTLAGDAAERHRKLGISNVVTRHADGTRPSGEGPFDRIVAWCSFETLPRHFTDQMASGGIMVAPIGPADGVQALAKLTKIGSRFEQQVIGQVRLQPAGSRLAEHL